MQRAWALNASNTPLAKPVSLEIGYAKGSSPGPGTVPGYWWHHMVTEELLKAITDAGLTPSVDDTDQLSKAIAIIAKQAVSNGAATPVRVVDTVGVTMSHAQSVDGVSLVTGDRYLRAISPTTADNGPYIVNTAAAWTRAPDFATGNTMLEGFLFSVAEGTANKGTIWQLAEVSGDSALIGTTSILFRNITDSLNAKFAQYLLASAAATTYAPLVAPAFSGAITLTNYTAGAVPYLNSSSVLTSDGNLSFDGTHLTTVGRNSAAAFVPSSATVPTNGMYYPATNTLGWSTNSVRAMSITSQGNWGVGATSAIYQGQISGAGQGSAALADGGAIGASLLLQDTNNTGGAGGALIFGTALGAASPFAVIKGLLTDTSTGKVGHVGFGVRTNSADITLTEAMRLTSTRNLLVGTTSDKLSSSVGNVVVENKVLSGQVIGSVTGTGGQVQAIGGSGSSWFNAMFRNDGTNAQLVSTTAQTTAVGAVDVVPNSFRPFSWNLTTGAVTIDATGVGVSFGGVVTGTTAATNDNSTKLATTAYVKANVAGAALATVGSSILSGNGSGGFTNVNIGSGLSFSSGTLSVTISGSSGGTVTSVGLVAPSFLSVSGSPVTGSGNLTLSYSGTALPVANGGTGTSTSTGISTSSVVLSNSPTLVNPALGTPSAITLTNGTGLPLTTGVTGTLGVANGGTGVTTSTGTGSNVLSNNATLVAPALGTPASGVLTNMTGLPLSTGVTGVLPLANGGTGMGTIAANSALFTTTSNTLTAGTLPVLAGGTGVTTSTGTGAGVHATSPTLVTPVLGTVAAGSILTNATGYLASNLSGNLAIGNFAGGTGANSTSFWRGDGTWAAPAGAGTVTNSGGNLTSNYLVLGAGTTDTKVTAGLITDGISKMFLGAAGSSVGRLALSNVTSGTVTLEPVTGALGTSTLSLPAATDTLVGKATTDILTNKTINASNNSLTNIPLGTAVTGTLAVANGGTGVTTGTGTGSNVLSNNATLVAPALGTPASGVLTSCTGLPIATGISGMGTGMATFLATPNSANLRATVTDETGTGALVFADSPTLISPALGTPSALTLTNATGLPVATGISGLATGVATFLATPTSANFLAAVTTKTGTGNVVFATSPTLVTPVLGTVAAGSILTNATGLPLTTGVTGVLPLANGGTSLSTIAANSALFTTSANTMSSGLLPLLAGGTGASTASAARTNLGLGTMAVEATTSWVSITGAQTVSGNKFFTGNTVFGATAAPFSVWNTYSKGQSGHPSIVAEAANATDSSALSCIVPNAAGAGNGGLIRFHNGTSAGATFLASISHNGTTVSYNTTSDYRLKENVTALVGASQKVMQLKPVEYTWKSKPGGEAEMGFLAHEVQEVIPFAVDGEKDAVQADGKIAPQQLDYSKVVPLLTASLQEALTRLAAMEAKMAAAGLM